MKQVSINKLLLSICTIIGVSILVTACGRSVDPEESCNFVQNHNLQRVSWQDRTPVKLYVHNSVPKQFYPSIERAMEAWNEALGKQVFSAVFGSGGPLEPKRDGYSVIYWFNSSWERDRFSEQGRTTVYWSGTQIYEADIRINNLDYQYFVSETNPDPSKVHFESLILHELGHVLGLSHNSNDDSVMRVVLHDGDVRNEVKNFDMNSLKCEY